MADIDGRASVLLTEFDRLLNVIAKKLTKHHRVNLPEGMSPPQFFILRMIAKQGPMTVSQLADMLGVTSGAVTGLTDKLQASGYADRNRSTEDRRGVNISLTEEGKRLVQKMEQQRREVLHTVMGQLSEKKLSNLVDILNDVATILE